ncbi:phytanoyl-CoA dioxygenase family protein [Mycolicibacterium neoaurum]|uniref:phytanoyl-CoA dioxygenase family protein n=1 Tax=Mycolicibacterium neoaurum TaxID=1795 RepID=UPI001F4CF5B3|nr:phytanoyl-CoA dioxygenase family protein [Mycolicibacterium neoaurum]
MLGAYARAPYWLTESDCDLEHFRSLVETCTDPAEYLYADCCEKNVLIYGNKCDAEILTGPERPLIQAEIIKALSHGPGVLIFRRAFGVDAIDRASAVFLNLIDQQKLANIDAGDHFGAVGANDRLWSGVEKLALHDPSAFVDYFSNDVIAAVSEAWLGPNYQIVSEPNLVKPGSSAQTGHRDYHLGLVDIKYGRLFPAHVHRFSAALTLQAAVAHVDMPLEAGPTRYLPYSHRYESGYLAMNVPDFQQYFKENCVQLQLRKGDVLFFNPAVMHGAGGNSTLDVQRLANLLQISSAFGRAAATVNTQRVVLAIYPELRRRLISGDSTSAMENVLTAAADGYPFPTNLDRDRPLDRLFPESELELTRRALYDGWDVNRLRKALADQSWRRRSSLPALGE